jgi:hypothetical protein
MQKQNDLIKSAAIGTDERRLENSLHPAWRTFVQYCLRLQHGEIEKLKIQDGLPVIAEVTRHKVKFTS